MALALALVPVAVAAPALVVTESYPGSAPARIFSASAFAAAPTPRVPNGLPSAIEKFSGYLPQTTCDPVAKPGVTAFRAMVMGLYRGTSDYGIVRDCGLGGTSEHKEGRAWDWKVSAYNSTQKEQADTLMAWLLAPDKNGNEAAMARRLGIMYIIWNRKIWGAYAADKGWRPYSGVSAHTDHVHFSFSWPGALKQTSFWTRSVATVPTTPVGFGVSGNGAGTTSSAGGGSTTVKFGDRGTLVAAVQKALKIDADGVFGNQTRTAVVAFQTRKNLVPDGVVGPTTLTALGLDGKGRPLSGASSAVPVSAPEAGPQARPPRPLPSPLPSPLRNRPHPAPRPPPDCSRSAPAAPPSPSCNASSASAPTASTAARPPPPSRSSRPARASPPTASPAPTPWPPSPQPHPSRRPSRPPRPRPSPPPARSSPLRNRPHPAPRPPPDCSRSAPAAAAVAELQRLLGISADGVYGSQTAAAVKKFQASKGLTADGIAGPNTVAALTATTPKPAPAPKPAASAGSNVVPASATKPVGYPGTTLKTGTRGAAVQTVQRALKISADGVFGPQTAAAVKTFQAANGLKPDGIVGPQTWAKLVR